MALLTQARAPNAGLQLNDQYIELVSHYTHEPVHFVEDCLGAKLEDWQAEVLETLAEEPRVAIKSCHGVGKTTVESWVILWYMATRYPSRMPTTAPTYGRQVRDILWAEVRRWWRAVERYAPWLASQFELTTTRLRHKELQDWYAIGVPSNEAGNVEGFHADYVCIVMDEAKGVPAAMWDAVEGMQGNIETKLLVASTPGGKVGPFFRVFQDRQSWPNVFSVHPRVVKPALKWEESKRGARGGVWYSDRPPLQWAVNLETKWGWDNPAFQMRVLGVFPNIVGDVLLPSDWLAAAENLTAGIGGPRVVSVDVARYGRDRTVLLVGEGGTMLHGEVIARKVSESFSPDVRPENVGPDPKHPQYRDTVATADAATRLRRDFGATAIVVDEGGIGGGVVDILRKRGERVIAVNFGAPPPDQPTSAEERESRVRRGLTADSDSFNMKAWMGRRLRDGFEQGQVALGQLPKVVRDVLIEQCSMVWFEYTATGRLKIVDPDDQDEMAQAAGSLEGKRSPDHFHSLLLYWYAAGENARGISRPVGQRAPHFPPTAYRGGVPMGSPAGASPGGGLVPQVRAGAGVGQVGYVRSRYGRW